MQTEPGTLLWLQIHTLLLKLWGDTGPQRAMTGDVPSFTDQEIPQHSELMHPKPSKGGHTLHTSDKVLKGLAQFWLVGRPQAGGQRNIR